MASAGRRMLAVPASELALFLIPGKLVLWAFIDELEELQESVANVGSQHMFHPAGSVVGGGAIDPEYLDKKLPQSAVSDKHVAGAAFTGISQSDVFVRRIIDEPALRQGFERSSNGWIIDLHLAGNIPHTRRAVHFDKSGNGLEIVFETLAECLVGRGADFR